MQLGTRWTFGDPPPPRLPAVMVDAVARVETERAGHAGSDDPRTWRWTLTWLEGRAVAELDDGTVLRHDPATDTVLREHLD
ncbi:hypothetical protein ACFPJ4_06775 [Lysinimonas soli]|uniref:Fe-S oxidoreductase n=1 Tax=Lysinimonas soli TaxID=1074233 RepID=A0ABW0NQJ5_9MICO